MIAMMTATNASGAIINDAEQPQLQADTRNINDIEQQQQQQQKRKSKQQLRQQQRHNAFSLFSWKPLGITHTPSSMLLLTCVIFIFIMTLLMIHSDDNDEANQSGIAQTLRNLWESATSTTATTADAAVADVTSTMDTTSYSASTTTTTADQLHPQYDHHHQQHHAIYQEEHAPLFPLTRSDRIGFVLATAGLMIAAGGGIGGGGILVPIYILILGFSPKHAIPLSNITVLGGAVANTILNTTRKRHPIADRPLVDWDLILVMEPLTIAGALLGAFLNKILPELFLTILLVILLSVTAQNSLSKAFKLYQAETRALQQQQQREKQSELTKLVVAKQQQQQDKDDESDDDDDDSDDYFEDADEEEQQQQAQQETTIAVRKTEQQEEQLLLAKILEQERHIPAENVKILIVLFVVVLTLNLLKGGGAFPSPLGITCGSAAFWWANAIMFVWILAVMWHCRNYLLFKYRQKAACGYQYLPGDIVWNERATVVYPAICCLAGFFAGMFGVGGGIVKGPLMLAMGIHPAVSSASSACMILFTSFTATTSFVVFGLLVPDYAVVCFVIGLGATFIGQIGLSYLMRKAQRNSYIAFSIGGVVLLSAFLMTIQSLLSMAAGEKHHSGGICGKGD